MAIAEPFELSITRRFGQSTSRAATRPRRRADVVVASLIVLVTVVALAAPLLAPHNPIVPVGAPDVPPLHGGFLLGTDSIGRDILSRVLYGIRTSWFSALGVVAVGTIVGGLIGLVAGTAGGVLDNILMRITDGFLAIPAPVVAIAVVAALGLSLVHTLIAVSIVWWPMYARIVRGEVRSLSARPHVEAARLAGNGWFRIATRHLLPGAIPATLVAASLDLGGLIITLAGLSFLGLGQAAPAPELGADTAQNLNYLLYDWWIPVMPGIAVTLLAVVANISGDAIRDLVYNR
jgi:peptide/nickel transport system permease protein